jgi:Chitobiase/beta-hexosaminidase C-terminal domain
VEGESTVTRTLDVMGTLVQKASIVQAQDIAVTILQACAATTTTTQCAKPTLTPPGYNGTLRNVTVTIKTATAGAYLRYTLDGSTPTGGPSGHGARIAAASGKVSFGFDARGKTLKAIAYKAGLVNSLIAVGNYVYESPR